ncbi:MAG: DUF2971 domain-containing protein, partial [Pseudorhodobacter sp.]
FFIASRRPGKAGCFGIGWAPRKRCPSLPDHAGNSRFFRRSFSSHQMWAHYADNFKGALITFKPASAQSIFTQAEKISYSDDPYFIFDADEFAKILTGQMSMSDWEFIARSIRKIVLSKKRSWSYENEWRINSGSGRSPKDEVEYLPFDKGDLHAVYFGLRSNPEFIQEVTYLAKFLNPKVGLYKSSKQLKANKIVYFPFD